MNSKTVWRLFYDLLRTYDTKTIFGSPGSTEQPMLNNFPPDLQYILGLQEASVVAIADGFSQATCKPVVIGLHTSAGTGNGMGNIMTAYLNKTPLILIAGQQTWEMLIGDPFLANRGAETMVQPYVKWAYQPVRAVSVASALVRVIATATMPPAGPVYLSIPLDGWDVPTPTAPVPRSVSSRVAPDMVQLAAFASRIGRAKSLALVLGAEVDRSLDWETAVTLAEKRNAPVCKAPFADRAAFPEWHRLYYGPLPPARGPLSKKLEGFDLVLVIGAELYYPYIAGPFLPPGTELLQFTNDPHDAAAALVGYSLLSDVKLALEALGELPGPLNKSDTSTVAQRRSTDSILVNEAPSNEAELLHAFPALQPESYFIFASGGLGWGAAASAGIAPAQKLTGSSRTTTSVISLESSNEQDIRAYVEAEFPALQDHPGPDRINLIKRTLVEKAKGVFQWLK